MLRNPGSDSSPSRSGESFCRIPEPGQRIPTSSGYASRPIRETANRRRRSARLRARGYPRAPAPERRLNGRCAAKSISGANVGGQQFRPSSSTARAAPRAARASGAARSPRRSRRARRAAALSVSCRSSRPTLSLLRVVPNFVGEALHVVREVAGQFDDGGAQPWSRPQTRGLESRLDEAANGSAGIFCSRMTGPAL